MLFLRMVILLSIFSFLFFLIQSPSLILAQYTDNYTSSYTDSYTSGYTDSYTGGYESGYTYTAEYTTCYGTCPGGPAVSGFVYDDKDNSATYNAGDRGLKDEVVQAIRPAYSTPAYTTPAYCEPTGTDENGNPIGETCYPAVYHPAASSPDIVIGQAATDVGGHYVIAGLPAGTYKIHHTRDPLWAGWIRTTPNDVLLVVNNSVNQSFGMTDNGFIQHNPAAVCNSTTPHISLWWDYHPRAVNYKVYYLDVSSGSSVLSTAALPSTANTYDFNPSTTPLTVDHPYTFIIAALDASGNIIAYSDDGKWSYEQSGSFTTYPNCSPSSTPTPTPTPTPSSGPPVNATPAVSISINGFASGSVPYVSINQNATANLTWGAGNVDPTCTASTASGNSSPLPNNGLDTVWTGSKPTSGGPISIPTSQSAIAIFSLICGVGATPYTASIQLNINQYPPAYFKTTGGDVHSNETIYITPP